MTNDLADPLPKFSHALGVVAIGRNEGDRLKACLNSIISQGYPVVYVDSGSTDGSVDYARALGATVVPLDLTQPFTAARARNEGFAALKKLHPNLTFVQFVDGDCTIDAAWWAVASHALGANPDLAIVCGRRRERFPAMTIYNHLCDQEWNTTVGPADACGGDALMRIAAFETVNGYTNDLIAGEEPELCLRLRERGYRIERIDAEMTTHDANMTQFRQWWKRNVRAGHAYAEVSQRHRHSPKRIWAKEVRSNFIWALGIPAIALAMMFFTYGISLVLFYLYPVQVYRIAKYRRRLGDTPRQAYIYAGFCVLGKWPQAIGQLTYWKNRLLGKRQRLIEYKGRPGQ